MPSRRVVEKGKTLTSPKKTSKNALIQLPQGIFQAKRKRESDRDRDRDRETERDRQTDRQRETEEEEMKKDIVNVSFFAIKRKLLQSKTERVEQYKKKKKYI